MKKKVKITILTFLLVLLFVSQLISIENIGQIGECFINAGYCRETKIIEDVAYVGCLYGLVILDVSDQNNPTMIGSFRTQNLVSSIDIQDNYAFLACGYSGVIIVNITDISNLSLAATITFPSPINYARIVSVEDDFLFVGMGQYNFDLNIVNISDISDPEIIANDDSGYYRNFVVDGNYIYALKYDFNIIDISQITNPILINSYDLGGSSIAIQDNKAYITSGDLTIVDISDPNNLNILGNCDEFQTSPYDLVVDDDYAFITGSDEMGIAVINISDSNNPYLIQEIEYKGIRISKQNNNLYISRIVDNYQTYNGIGIIDVENLNNINVVGEFKTCKANKFYFDGNYSYVANGFRGLTILDVSNPYNPTSISNFNTICKATDVIVDSDIAYVAVADSCLQIIDVSNPSLPFLLGDVTFPNYTMQTVLNVDKYGDYIYIGGNFMWEMIVINVSDPINPIIENQQDVNDFCYDIDVYEDNLFLAGYWGGLQIFDLVNPIFPNEVGYYPLDLALCVKAAENKVFIGDPYTSLRIFDTSDISNPILTETYSIEDVEDMFCSNDTLFVASDTGLHLFNVSDPYNSYEIMTLEGQYPKGVTCQNDYIFSTESFEFKIYGDTTLVSVDDNVIVNNPNKYNLSNYPNPFNPITTIFFSIQENSEINLSIYNIKGQKIKTLIDDKIGEGDHSISWKSEDENNNSVSSGVYFYKLNVNGKNEVIKKCLLLK